MPPRVPLVVYSVREKDRANNDAKRHELYYSVLSISGSKRRQGCARIVEKSALLLCPFVLRLFFFCINVLCQVTPLLNLRPFIFGLTPFGWLPLLREFLVSEGNIIFINVVFIYAHFYRNATMA
jgi:hypothetical protein